MTDTLQSETKPLFYNSFQIEDLLVFDDQTLQEMVEQGSFGLSIEQLAVAMHGTDEALVKRIIACLSKENSQTFRQELKKPVGLENIYTARRQILNNLFWELTYWKTPNLYEELTEGENLHPAIFKALKKNIKGKVVVDVGAGSGRASFESLKAGAEKVIAVEPSPGLLNILKRKVASLTKDKEVIPKRGKFSEVPLPDNAADVTISCSAFTAEPEQGGEPGLAELKRVTRPGGKIVIIWPRREDLAWLTERGFNYIAMPTMNEMKIRFRSLKSAWNCAHTFYRRNRRVAEYLEKHQKPEVPFSVLGINPPLDYCWLNVSK